ncbi:methyltransferase domain-containing protein [Pseudonocardia acaciae]|uniref:methyltransferase domain-containing protein n=1 Tax=Pseudonocardia acaciae TaxID=551276 RepID=UPI000688967E|nr:methyltransferase domain-containing protein [Pseudonocardia acaciae]
MTASDDPARRAILERLGRGASTEENLADVLSLGRPAVSEHLAALTEAGLVVATTIDARRIYRVTHDYDQMYADDSAPPWEIGRPQPALAALLDRIDIESPVLDVGCGTGELAIHVAEKGHRVVGIDFSGAGIAKARFKAAEEGLDIEFRVADARCLGELDIRPRTVLDSGLLHSLDEKEERLAYVTGLEAICDPGALVCILAVSTEAGMGWGVTRDSLAGAFSEPHWADTDVARADVLARVGDEELQLPALLLTSRRL